MAQKVCFHGLSAYRNYVIISSSIATIHRPFRKLIRRCDDMDREVASRDVTAVSSVSVPVPVRCLAYMPTHLHAICMPTHLSLSFV